MAPNASQISVLIDQGMSAGEVAAAIGTTRTRVIRLVHQHGIQLAPGGCRRVASTLAPARYRALETIAARAQVSTGVMASRIIGLVVEDAAALRKLGRLAEPKRAYRRRCVT
jgi:hypothetical protein